MIDIIREEIRAMDALPRKEAYLSMLILGFGLGLFLSSALYVVARLLLR